MTSNFIGWSDKDLLAEVRECYECICSTATSLEDKLSAMNVIAFAAVDSTREDQTQATCQYLLKECSDRIAYNETGRFPKISKDYDPNACKGCGGTDYESVGGVYIACIDCGQDFDNPHMNWH